MMNAIKMIAAIATATMIFVSSTAVADSRVAYANSYERSSACSTIWADIDHRWRYERFVPNIYVKVKMWVKSKTYLGSPTNPLSCWEKWYFSDRITNEGELYADAPQNGWPLLRLLKMSHSAHNQALYETYKSDSGYGDSAQKPQCGYSKHYFVINGKTYLRTKRKGYCAQNIPN